MTAPKQQRLRFALLALGAALVMWGMSAGYRAMLAGSARIVERAVEQREAVDPHADTRQQPAEARHNPVAPATEPNEEPNHAHQ